MLLCCLIDVWNVAKASDLTLVSTGCDVSSSGDEMLSVSVQAEAQQVKDIQFHGTLQAGYLV